MRRRQPAFTDLKAGLQLTQPVSLSREPPTGDCSGLHGLVNGLAAAESRGPAVEAHGGVILGGDFQEGAPQPAGGTRAAPAAAGPADAPPRWCTAVTPRFWMAPRPVRSRTPWTVPQ